MPEVLIRPESETDVPGIREVNIQAFRDHPFSRQTEHLIVEALRAAGALEVSLVAVAAGRIVGHVAFSKALLGGSQGEWFILGPLAVLPGFQERGIGSALVTGGLDELHARGATGCLLVGDPAYYARFGFGSFPGLTYEGVPDDYVLALPLGESVPRGMISAHQAFAVEAE